MTWLRFMLLRISQGESVGPSSSFLFTLLTFRENSKLPEYQIVCLFAFPCHLVISAGIILYWLSYLRPSHSSRRLPLPGSDLHAGLPSIHMQRGSPRIPQFSELRHPLVVLTYWQVAIDCWLWMIVFALPLIRFGGAECINQLLLMNPPPRGEQPLGCASTGQQWLILALVFTHTLVSPLMCSLERTSHPQNTENESSSHTPNPYFALPSGTFKITCSGGQLAKQSASHMLVGADWAPHGGATWNPIMW